MLIVQDHGAAIAALTVLGLAYAAQGRYAESEPLYERALTVYGKSLGQDHPRVATVMRNLSRLRRMMYRTVAMGQRDLASIAHPHADPDHAARLNLDYMQEFKRWEGLPWWKRLLTKQPRGPSGI